MRPRALIIDDELEMADTYAEILRDEGWETALAHTADAARARLAGAEWDVVVLDKKLEGPHGPDVGLDLVTDIRNLCPRARILMITGYPDPAAMQAAYRRGVYDYITKDPRIFMTALPIKARNALEAIHERQFARLAGDDHALRRAWALSQTSADANERGAALEQVMALLFQAIPGWERTTLNVRHSDQEIDVVVQNHIPTGFWRDVGPYVFCECKRWSRVVGAPIVDLLASRLKKSGLCHLGILVAAGGASAECATAARIHLAQGIAILVIAPPDLDRLISAAPDSRLAILAELHQRLVAGQ